MMRSVNWNSLSAGALTIGLQFLMLHQQPGLSMELMTIFVTAIGIVWLAAGIQWVNPSERFYWVGIRLVRMQFVTNFALALWFATLETLKHAN